MSEQRGNQRRGSDRRGKPTNKARESSSDSVRRLPSSRTLVDQARTTGQEMVTRLGLGALDDGGDGAGAGAIGSAPPGRGMEEPGEIAETIALVDRAFAFVDLCGFTRFLASNGEHAAIDALSRFRSLARAIAVRRGVLVAKWLGDGAMIVGLDVGPTVATAAELIGRYDGSTLALRGGFAHGKALIVDGDDYIGRPANLAARLCQVARPEELLAVGYDTSMLPPWIQVDGVRSVTLPGLGRFRRAQRLGLVEGLALPELAAGDGS
jgi:class 3 adenylate cyclase